MFSSAVTANGMLSGASHPGVSHSGETISSASRPGSRRESSLSSVAWILLLCSTSPLFAGPPIVATMPTSVVSPVGETAVPVTIIHNGIPDFLGFEFYFCSDPSVVEPVAVSLSEELLTVNNGNLPEFSNVSVSPEGATVQVLFTFGGFPFTPLSGTETPLGEISYLAIGIEGDQTSIFSCPLTDPPAASIAFIDGNQVLADLQGELIVGTHFRRGDINDDGLFDLADPIALGAYLFTGGADSVCPRAGDVNLDGVRDLADMITMIQALFGGGSSEGFGECQLDPSSHLPCQPTGSCPN